MKLLETGGPINGEQNELPARSDWRTDDSVLHNQGFGTKAAITVAIDLAS